MLIVYILHHFKPLIIVGIGSKLQCYSIKIFFISTSLQAVFKLSASRQNLKCSLTGPPYKSRHHYRLKILITRWLAVCQNPVTCMHDILRADKLNVAALVTCYCYCKQLLCL